MNGIHKFSAQVIDYAERLSDVADAAQGKNHSHRHSASAKRWLLLPASGAALYALVKSDSFSRQAKDVMDDAKTRAAELPEELIGLVRQTTERSPSRNGRAHLDRPELSGRQLPPGGEASRANRQRPSASGSIRGRFDFGSPWRRPRRNLSRASRALKKIESWQSNHLSKRIEK